MPKLKTNSKGKARAKPFEPPTARRGRQKTRHCGLSAQRAQRKHGQEPTAKSQEPTACFYAAAFCDAAGGSGCGRARANMPQTQNQLNRANKYAKRKRKTTKTSSPPKVEVFGSSLH